MTPVDPYLAHLRQRSGGAGILVQARDTKRALLLHDPYSGLWTTPGGGIESGENALGAAIREFTEETGYGGQLRLDYSRRVLIEPTNYHLFFATVPREFVPVLSHEHDAFVWAPLYAPPEPLHPGLEKLVR